MVKKAPNLVHVIFGRPLVWWFDPLFLRTTLIATWAFALLCDCSISWNSSTCFFKTRLLEKILSQIQQMCVLVHFLRITLIATWAFTLLYDYSIPWALSTCFLKHIYKKNLYHKSYNFMSPHFHELSQHVS